MVFIGVVVGGMVIGMYLPIFKLAATVWISRCAFRC